MRVSGTCPSGVKAMKMRTYEEHKSTNDLIWCRSVGFEYNILALPPDPGRGQGIGMRVSVWPTVTAL